MKFTKIIVSLLMLGVTCLVAAALVRPESTSKDSTSLKTELATVATGQDSRERGPVRMIRFVLFADGIYPRQMRVDHGLINLALEDKSGASEGLVLERVVNNARERVITIRRVQNHWRGRELVRLPPGQYIVYDASQPNYKADLLVEP